MSCTISPPLLKEKVLSSICFLLLAAINITSLAFLMKTQVSQKLFFFLSEGYLHLAQKSAWPWKAIFPTGAATAISLITLQSHFKPQQSISCPCSFFSQLVFSVIALYYHDAGGNCGPKAGVGLLFIFHL